MPDNNTLSSVRLRENEGNTVKDYINLIRLNLIPILLISLAGLAVALIYAANAVDIYRSSTMFQLSTPQGNILEAPLLPEFQNYGMDRFIANEIEIIKSFNTRLAVADRILDSVTTSNSVTKLDYLLNKTDPLNPVLMSRAQIAAVLSDLPKIEQKRGLDIVQIDVETPSPYETALIANCYTQAYRDLNLLNNRLQLTSVKEFLANQRVEKLNDLQSAENNLKSYQEKGGVIRLDEQASALISQLTSFEAQLNSTRLQLTISVDNLNKYKERLKEIDPDVNAYLENISNEPYIKSLQEQIIKLEIQKDLALSGKMQSAEKNAVIAEYDNKIKDLQRKLEPKLKVLKSSIFASSPENVREWTARILEEEIKTQGLKSSEKQLTKIVADYEKRFNSLPKSTIDLARLERERVAIEKLYLLVEEKYQEALINEQSTPGSVFIIDKAFVPEKPTKPNRTLIVIAGLIMGIGMGIAVAFIRNYFDNTVKTPEDIQAKGVNVLAWIPQIEGVVDSSNIEFEFIVARRPDSIPSEAFRALRTRIQFSRLDAINSKVLLVTSAAPREGKTIISINLAGSFAQANKRVVVVDCDLRKPRVHTIMKVKKLPGFTDYCFGKAGLEDIIRKSELENLDFITSGTIPPNPSEILGSNQMSEFLERLKGMYDIVMLDSPPVVAVTDSEILSRIADSTLLVVSANTTENDLMLKAVELLSHETRSFVGVILNNFSYKAGYGSYYKYYYYYSRPAANQGKKA